MDLVHDLIWGWAYLLCYRPFVMKDRGQDYLRNVLQTLLCSLRHLCHRRESLHELGLPRRCQFHGLFTDPVDKGNRFHRVSGLEKQH